MTIKPEIKARWIAALRSGDYQQTVRTLRRIDSYCCLGVLCELHRNAVGLGEDVWSSGGEYQGTSGIPSEAVCEWAGMKSKNPMVGDKTLTDWNDHEGKNFAEIADIIEADL